MNEERATSPSPVACRLWGVRVGTEVFAGGTLRVTVPDTVVARSAPADRPRRRRRGGAAAESDYASLLVAALGQQDLELIEPVDLAAAPAAARRRGTRNSSETNRVTIDLDVAADEDAVVLLDHDDLLTWQMPTNRTTTGDPLRRRRGAAATGKVVRFDIDLGAAAQTAPSARRARGSSGRIGGSILGRVRAYVFKFVAKPVTGKAMTFLERHTRPGLIVLESSDPKAWHTVERLSDVELPSEGPARILLLVHGTFSSTVGSFGALAATADGRQFLNSALVSYDTVIGFEHPTLSRDPLENAIDLLARLETARLPAPPTIDILCYSRGGLVARSLIEYLLPSSGWRAHTGRVVFVGATNGGTAFADPDNWEKLVDLYTNLAVASARAVGLLSGSVPTAEIVNGALESVGAFVKYLVAYTVDGGGVPGLAAMKPNGEFVRRLNQTQPGQPVPDTPWFVVSSDFQPQLVGDGQLKELPERFVGLLADGFVDRLMKSAPNDLVVDTASMSAIDLPTGDFVEDGLAFGANGRVYHLAYFIQPEVCAALRDWLVPADRAVAVPPAGEGEWPLSGAEPFALLAANRMGDSDAQQFCGAVLRAADAPRARQ